ncbi:MAG: ABC transporter permease, partial [Candidatus Thermoplasmatota archaeon]|nr:ABC transporter permease [Candidatus Thermoplasmatota archaeon]
NGTFHINGTISLNYQRVFPGENMSQEDLNRTQEEVNESMGKGRVEINGSVNGSGSLGGGFGMASQNGFLYTNGFLSVNGFLIMGEMPEFSENKTTNGTDPEDDPPKIPPEFFGYLKMMGLEDLIPYLLLIQGVTYLEGNGTISGNGTVSGNGTIDGWVESKEDEIDFTGGQGYFSAIIIIFTMLLAAIICADVISADLANSSFVLYFSRPVRAFDYLLGKIVGLTWVMWLFCLIPPALYVLVMLGTQAGDDYSDGFKILGKTLWVGLVTSFYFLPYGLMISSFTKSKAYAGIGIFMSFFVLLIISGIFSETSDKWSLISPVELLINFYKITYGGSIPDGITSGQVAGAILAFTVIPMAIVIYWIYRKGAGK